MLVLMRLIFHCWAATLLDHEVGIRGSVADTRTPLIQLVYYGGSQ